MRRYLLKEKIIIEIEKCIEKYDYILVFNDKDTDIEGIKSELLQSDILKNYSKKYLFMGMNDLKVSDDIDYMTISVKEYEEIFSLYRMYEFTDKLRFVSSSTQFGSMLNYLSTGIITKQEYFKALLC